MRLLPILLSALCVAGCATGPDSYHLISGRVPLDGSGPDGNTVVLDAPDGLIVVDSGRHPEHVRAILDHAAARRKPIAAIVNSHWHFDHTSGNRDILARHPGAAIVTSRAVDGRLYREFAARSRQSAEDYLQSGKASAKQRAEIERGFGAMDDHAALRPTRPIEHNGPASIAGRTLDLRLAPLAATEGDTWVVVEDEQLVIAGDLVVDVVPFMDTACVAGWMRALGDIATVPFTTLVPGHGEPMTKPQFMRWKSAFEGFVACGRSTAPARQCAEEWLVAAAPFVGPAHRDYARQAAVYYIDSRLRSAPAEQSRYCSP